MKKILITGANKGIGLATARQLLKAGCFVFLGSRDLTKGEEAVRQLKEEGLTHVEAIALDVSNEKSVKQALEQVRKKTNVLDALINNAGILGVVPQSALTGDIENIKQVFETNFFGSIRVTQTFMHLLQNADAPRIVNVTSDLASLSLHNDPSWPYYQFKGAAYGPSKTALNAYTVALAYELRDTRFKINAVNPGYTATDFNQHRGTKSVIEAACLIAGYALLNNEVPNGKFMGEKGEIPW